MISFCDDNQVDIIETFNTTCRYPDNVSHIDNLYFEVMVSHIYPSELQLNRASAADTEV